MDLNTHFIENYSRHYIETRRASASEFGYGNGTPVATMIAVSAALIRRAAGTIERWARGTNVEVIDRRLPRLDSAR